MNRCRAGAQVLLILVVLSAGALAQDGSIGSITKGYGEIVVIRAAGGEESAGVGTAIFQQDQIYVGADGLATVTFIDETIVTLGANSALTIDEMVFDPASQANSGLLSLAGGVMGLVSGQIVKSGDMTVTTPVSTIGIRGTSVLIDTGFVAQLGSAGIATVEATGAGGESISLVLSQDGSLGLVQVTTASGETFTLDVFGATVFIDPATGTTTFGSSTATDIQERFGAVLQALNNAAGRDLTDPENATEADEVKRSIDDLLELLQIENQASDD